MDQRMKKIEKNVEINGKPRILAETSTFYFLGISPFFDRGRFH